MASPIRCLVSAGPTREYFDPVRFLSNPSSGKMGYALAEAARDAGWEVTLVSGPVQIAPPDGVEVISVETGEEMFAALQARFAASDVLIMTAAVMDSRPKVRATRKIKKHELPDVLEMEPTVDILKTLGAAKREGQALVGFAAETNDMEANALKKLEAKNCDLLIGNVIGEPGRGFQSDTNEVVVFDRKGGRTPLGPETKQVLAREIVAMVSACFPEACAKPQSQALAETQSELRAKPPRRKETDENELAERSLAEAQRGRDGNSKYQNINDLSGEIIHLAYQIHRDLGPGLFESVYEEAIAAGLTELGIPFTRQTPIEATGRDVPLSVAYKADIIVDNRIIIELKSVTTLQNIHKKQLVTYLKLTGIKLGLLLNFNEVLLKDGIVRIANRL